MPALLPVLKNLSSPLCWKLLIIGMIVSRNASRLNGILTAKFGQVVTPGRLELPTNSLGNCCSIHLSYGAPGI
jgi:hypothetical protein